MEFVIIIIIIINMDCSLNFFRLQIQTINLPLPRIRVEFIFHVMALEQDYPSFIGFALLMAIPPL
jgi:hypothetical protein